MPLEHPGCSSERCLSDRFRVERELGSGGLATVYLAPDLKHDCKVASDRNRGFLDHAGHAIGADSGSTDVPKSLGIERSVTHRLR